MRGSEVQFPLAIANHRADGSRSGRNGSSRCRSTMRWPAWERILADSLDSEHSKSAYGMFVTSDPGWDFYIMIQVRKYAWPNSFWTRV